MRFGGREYPAAIENRSIVDIQVRRDETEITLTNTSSRSFGPGTMWINGAFGRELDGFAIAQTLTLDLRQFRNEFNEPFRAGGFFATQRPDELIVAELEIGDEMIGLIVIGQDNP